MRAAKLSLRGLINGAYQHLFPPNSRDLKAVNVALVNKLKSRLSHDKAMETAIGGEFERIGVVQFGVLRGLGLQPNDVVVDVGCGSGRLSRQLAPYLRGPYVGVDLVPDLVRHARRVSNRPDWRFEVVDHIAIPVEDDYADVVCFFSVLTHLLHEQSFWYLEEARRVLKPGGRVVFSFLEFGAPAHMSVFFETLEGAKRRTVTPMNVFLERNAIAAWAEPLGLTLEAFYDCDEPLAEAGPLGQSLCVLRKPL